MEDLLLFVKTTVPASLGALAASGPRYSVLCWAWPSFCTFLVALEGLGWNYGLLQMVPNWIQTLQWILDDTQCTYTMRPEMIDDGMKNIKEIPCHLVLLIVCWLDGLQIPVHVAFENRCKYRSLALSSKYVNAFERKVLKIIWPRSVMCREKESKPYFKVICSYYLVTNTALAVNCWQYMICSTQSLQFSKWYYMNFYLYHYTLQQVPFCINQKIL